MWNASPSEIMAAGSRIDPLFLATPLRRSSAFDRRFGAELLFKDETATPIRSFKGRGACNFIAQAPRIEGVVCASAGNFGQGLAWACRARGLPLTVLASLHAVPSKIAAMRSLGATVVLQGADFDAAKEAARSYAAASGLPYVEDGAHAAIAEGAGTIALELTEETEPFDCLIAPLGNGALVAGLGAWVKYASPATAMLAVCARGAPAMGLSVQQGRVVTADAADTIADGIAVRIPVPSAVLAVGAVVDEVLFVNDDHIRAAMALLEDELGLVVEPAGATGMAALIADPNRWRGKRLAIPLCGGNR
jgi:threonine dehydratase